MYFHLHTISPRRCIVATSRHFSNHTLAGAVFPAKLRIPQARDTNLAVNHYFVTIAAVSVRLSWQTRSQKRNPSESRIQIGPGRLSGD